MKRFVCSLLSCCFLLLPLPSLAASSQFAEPITGFQYLYRLAIAAETLDLQLYRPGFSTYHDLGVHDLGCIVGFKVALLHLDASTQRIQSLWLSSEIFTEYQDVHAAFLGSLVIPSEVFYGTPILSVDINQAYRSMVIALVEKGMPFQLDGFTYTEKHPFYVITPN